MSGKVNCKARVKQTMPSECSGKSEKLARQKLSKILYYVIQQTPHGTTVFEEFR